MRYAVALKIQILQILRKRPFDPRKLPPDAVELLIRPRKAGWQPKNLVRAWASQDLYMLDQSRSPYFAVLRGSAVRPTLLREWQAAAEAAPVLGDKELHAAANRVLRRAIARVYGREIAKRIAHHTTRYGTELQRRKHRAALAKSVVGAKRVQVIAARSQKYGAALYQKGQRFRVSAYDFLYAVRTYFLHGDRFGPLFEVDPDGSLNLERYTTDATQIM